MRPRGCFDKGSGYVAVTVSGGVVMGDGWKGADESVNGFTRTELGLYIPERRRRYSRPVGVDLFAGAGGFSLGFHQAGFHVVAAVELDPHSAFTYMNNLARPGVRIHFDTEERELEFARIAANAMGVKIDKNGHVKASKSGKPVAVRGVAGSGWISQQPDTEPGCEHFFMWDARNLTGKRILDAIGLQPGEVDCVFGGPPCQGFSVAGRRNVVDPRNSLVFEFARLVLEIQPKTMVFENVPGILSMTTPEGIPVVDAICRVLSDGGFGGYDALRKGLLSTSGSGAALRKTSNGKRQPGPDDDEDEEQERQLSLFDMAT